MSWLQFLLPAAVVLAGFLLSLRLNPDGFF
jgi:hypothetical protein